MSFMVIVAAVALLVFVFSYIRSGRLGFTVLALGAGYLLALFWVDVLTDSTSVQLSHVSWRDAVYAGLVLTPGALALLFSAKQKSILPRAISALVISILVVVLLLPILGAGSRSGEIYAVAEENRELIISAVLLIGLLDMMFSRLPKAPKRSKD